MKHARMISNAALPGFAGRWIVVALVLLAVVFTCPAHAVSLVSSFDTVLQPGVSHGFLLGPSSLSGGYLAEITPTVPGTNGESIELQVIQPEFNGAQWNDVLRVRLSTLYPGLPVNIRIYDTSGLPTMADFTTTLQPGVWHGFSLGPSSQTRGFLAEITPVGGGTDGQTIQRYVVQPEFNGTQWNDVFRAQISNSYAPLDVHIRIYGTDGLPVIAEFPTTLQPGVWHGFTLGQSIEPGGFLAEISPSAPGTDGETIERSVIQPEFNGVEWNDVLRLQLGAFYAPLNVYVRIYRMYAPPTSGTRSTWGRLKAMYR